MTFRSVPPWDVHLRLKHFGFDMGHLESILQVCQRFTSQKRVLTHSEYQPPRVHPEQIFRPKHS